MKTIYIADDGAEFENYYECKSYDAALHNKEKQYPNAANLNGEKVSINSLFNSSISNYEREERLSDIFYLWTDSIEKLENFQELCHEYGIMVPEHNSSTDLIALYWDDETGDWEDFYELESKFNKLQEIFDKISF